MLVKKTVVILHDDYNKYMFFSKILNNRFIFKQNQDVFDNYQQCKTIGIHLKKSGYKVINKPFNKKLLLKKDNIVFNIVETVNNDGSLIYKAPEFLEEQNIKFTGGSSKVIKITTDKVLTKQVLIKNSIPTPGWVSLEKTNGFKKNRHYIIKPKNEDASIGINSDSVIYIDNLETLLNKLSSLEEIDKKEYFAEEYIDGREFNISIINNNNKPLVLPPAELVFNNFTNDRFKVACYKSKWSEGSFEYENTKRTFTFKDSDKELLEEINNIAYRCWNIFSLKGYARVDLRVDTKNRPMVLEINSNPCIALDSGFTAAAFEYGYSYSEILENIISDLN